jgi:hypothetical protein
MRALMRKTQQALTLLSSKKFDYMVEWHSSLLDATSILSCNFSSLNAENPMTDSVHIDV